MSGTICNCCALAATYGREDEATLNSDTDTVTFYLSAVGKCQPVR